MHSSSHGSGFHSPLLIHIVELLPASTRPGGQIKLAVFPSIGRPLYTTVGVELLAAGSSRSPQFAINRKGTLLLNSSTVCDTY